MNIISWSINTDDDYTIKGGDDDPAGEFGKSIKLIYNNFKNLNFIDVTMKLYSKARYELLNEINNEEVYRDVLKWLNIH